MKAIGIIFAVFCVIATSFVFIIFFTDFLPSPRTVAITAYMGAAVAWGLVALGALNAN